MTKSPVPILNPPNYSTMLGSKRSCVGVWLSTGVNIEPSEEWAVENGSLLHWFRNSRNNWNSLTHTNVKTSLTARRLKSWLSLQLKTVHLIVVATSCRTQVQRRESLSSHSQAFHRQASEARDRFFRNSGFCGFSVFSIQKPFDSEHFPRFHSTCPHGRRKVKP